MWQLNLPAGNIRVKKNNDRLQVFDIQRKKWVSLTPEEWVRQQFIHYLINFKGIPTALLAIEVQITQHGMKKRCDAILYNMESQPLVLIEFKAPNIPITQATIDQTAVYNQSLNVPFFIVSNGMEHLFCFIDSSNKTAISISETDFFFKIGQKI